MGHEDVGALASKALVLVWKDRCLVASWQAAAPALGGADDLEAICGASVSRFQRRRPNGLAEDAAEAGDAVSGHFNDAPVQIAVRELGAE